MPQTATILFISTLGCEGRVWNREIKRILGLERIYYVQVSNHGSIGCVVSLKDPGVKREKEAQVATAWEVSFLRAMSSFQLGKLEANWKCCLLLGLQCIFFTGGRWVHEVGGYLCSNLLCGFRWSNDDDRMDRDIGRTGPRGQESSGERTRANKHGGNLGTGGRDVILAYLVRLLTLTQWKQSWISTQNI